ncbi:MAG: hypothetical protein QOG80_2214 [Pseudonocardiales bacterium]|nr:hypothetical protein [Pseudonocardiales bacterium]
MHAVDVIAVCAAVLLILALAAVLARQRYMLSVAGGQPVAVRVGNQRWIYGIGRYVGSELRWYRAIGLGTRPTAVLDRACLQILNHRPPLDSELGSLPPTAIVVECRNGDGAASLAFGESGFTGFVSWLEAASRS